MKAIPWLGGLLLPDDFNDRAHDTVQKRVVAFSDSHAGPWRSFTAAWIAVAYRFRAADEANTAFGVAMRKGDGPAQNDRYQQEQAQFAFFSAALSTIECTCFAAYCLGSLVNSMAFPTTSDKELNVSPKAISKLFGATFTGCRFGQLLSALLLSAEFIQLSDIRNVLSHRGTLPRQFHVQVGSGPHVKSGAYFPSNPKSLSTDWIHTLPIGAELTDDPRRWLGLTLKDLFDALDDFTKAHVRRP